MISKLLRGVLVAVLPIFIITGCNNQNNDHNQMDHDSKETDHANMNNEDMDMSSNDKDKDNKTNEMEFAKPPSSFNRLANQNIMITVTKNVTVSTQMIPSNYPSWFHKRFGLPLIKKTSPVQLS
ncbi:hypothetical protein RFB12_14545 [Parageobacillus toebii]|nr:hypothetical protein [Parageobacillus toebii]WMT18484.1 hypothetical protein RFB12_14545 [Parageobacillus toebii]